MFFTITIILSQRRSGQQLDAQERQHGELATLGRYLLLCGQSLLTKTCKFQDDWTKNGHMLKMAYWPKLKYLLLHLFNEESSYQVLQLVRCGDHASAGRQQRLVEQDVLWGGGQLQEGEILYFSYCPPTKAF